MRRWADAGARNEGIVQTSSTDKELLDEGTSSGGTQTDRGREGLTWRIPKKTRVRVTESTSWGVHETPDQVAE